MQASVVDPDFGVVADCNVRDVSLSGAKLELNGDKELPSIVWLKMKNDPQLRYCVVRWQRGQSAGVEFVVKKALVTAEQEIRKSRQPSNLGKLDKRSGYDRRPSGRKRPGKDRRSDANEPLNSTEV